MFGHDVLKRMWRSALTVLFTFFVGCASTSPEHPSEVLEPVEDKNSFAQEAMNPAYLQLAQVLKSLGYEPIGIQYETQPVIEVLNKVFLDPRTHNRVIALLYTGLQMSYDKSAQSLTIGGTSNISAIVAYIQKNVPLRPKEQMKAVTPLHHTIPATKPLLPGFKLPNRVPSPTPSPSPVVPPPSEPEVAPQFELSEPTPTPEPAAPTQEPTTLMPEESTIQ